jgi:hypothetical protein
MRLTDDLILPDDADTRRTVFLGMSGSGKTSGAKVLVEALIAAVRRVAILDPQGVFWGMRTSADGASAGLPFVVFGGRYGDIPLERGAGAAVADLVIDEGLPVILDLSAFEDDESILTVAADFVTRLRSRQNRDLEPVHLVADEADMLAPQMARRGAEDRCQRALRNVARRSRADGLGLTCITQRPVGLHTDILNMAEAVFLLRFAGFNDLQRVQDWIGALVSREQRDELMAGIPTLADGEAFVASPQWMKTFRRFRFPLPATFDSSATPKSGGIRRVTARASIDLAALSSRFTAAITAEAESDPEALRKRITDLTRQLADKPATQRVEVPVVPAEQIERLSGIADGLAATGKDLVGMGQEMLATATMITEGLRGHVAPIVTVEPADDVPEPPADVPTPPKPPDDVAKDRRRRAQHPTRLRILDAIAGFSALGITSVSRSNAAVYADISPTSGALGTHISALKSEGLIDYPQPGFLCLTTNGKELAVSGQSPVRLADLHKIWSQKLPVGQWRLLKVAINHYPNKVSRNMLADQAEMSRTSGGLGTHIADLKSLGLISYPEQGFVRATKLLFPDGLK